LAYLLVTPASKINKQGWVFAMAKSIFARTVEKTGKNHGNNWQKPE